MKKALVLNNTVIQVEAEAFAVAPPLFWADCEDSIFPGFGYIDGSFDIPETPKQIPSPVTMRQARLALLAIGKLSLVDNVIDSLSEPEKTAARIEWNYSNDVHIDKAFVMMLASALGMSDEDLDNLFIEASKL